MVRIVLTFSLFYSPLFSMLQALVNTSIVNGDVDLVNDTVASLLCIFRAIKRADDAIDAQKTPVSVALYLFGL